MKRISILLGLFAAGWGDAHASPASTNSAAAGRVLMIETSSMPVAAGKATLIIGELQRSNGVYSGDYRIKVFPYFTKNEKGRLAIVISDKLLAEAGQGKVVSITGTATTTKTGKSRPVTATATPVNGDHGTLKLWFTAGTREMTFEPAYHFAGKPLVLAQAAGIKF